MVIDGVQACTEKILSSRIIADYVEMPGLSVTLAQACRLWDLDRPTCGQVLNCLLAARFLRKSGDSFVRADSGRVTA
jgi:hypothetical protein